MTKSEGGSVAYRIANVTAVYFGMRGVTGRSAEAIAASFLIYLKTACRDVRKVTMWLDNCSAQNKNWSLLSALLHAVHAQETQTKCITLQFFEPGHTAMAADAVHRTVSQNLRKAPVVDFADYVSSVEAANVTVKLMDGSNMPAVTDVISRSRLATLSRAGERPYLADARLIQVRRGSTCIYLKTSFNAPTWNAFDLCKAKFDPSAPLPLAETGVSDEVARRVSTILSRMGGAIPLHKRLFWEAMAADEARGNEPSKKRKA